MTRRLEPIDRIKGLGDVGVPFPVDVHAFIGSDDAPSLETSSHRTFVDDQVNKVNPRKEFFRIDFQRVRQELKRRESSAHGRWQLPPLSTAKAWPSSGDWEGEALASSWRAGQLAFEAELAEEEAS